MKPWKRAIYILRCMGARMKKIYSAFFAAGQNAVTPRLTAVSVYTDKYSPCQTKVHDLTLAHWEKRGRCLREIKKGHTFAVASQERRCSEERLKKRCKINLVVSKSGFIFALALKAERQIFRKGVFRTGCTRHKSEIKNPGKFAGNKKQRIFAVRL